MVSFAVSVWEWFTSSVDWLWLSVGFGVVFLYLFRLSWPALAGRDSMWSEEQFKVDHPRSSWNKATCRRFSWPRLGLPYFVIAVAAVVAWIYWAEFGWIEYFTIALLWLLTAPLRLLWLVATVRKIRSARSGLPPTLSYWEQVSQYYDSGFHRSGDAAVEPWFKRDLQWLNSLQRFRFLIHIFRMWRAVGAVFAALVWPVTVIAMPFWHIERAEDKYAYEPWWRSER